MAEEVKPKRRYESPRRREQAAATRRAVLEAAERRFGRDGFAAATVAGVAAEAGVAPKTVYLAFGTKSGVLRALWNLRLRGDQDDVPVARQPWYRAVLDERDPERQLRLNARNSREGKQRIAGVLEIIRSAAPVDPDIGALWQRIGAEYRDNQREICRSLAAKGALRQGLGVERAADVLWTINHPSTWQLLVGERGWAPQEYERWCGDLACAELLRAPSSARGSPS